MIAWWYRIPSIAVITGLGHLFTFPSWKTWVAKWLYKFSLPKAAQVWFLNQEDLHFFARKRLIRPQQAIYLPSEGVDTEHFSRAFNKPKQPANSTFTFLFAGRLMDEKGIRDYVEAARIIKKQHSNVQFEILGFIEDDFPYAVNAQELNAWQKEGIIHYLGSTDDIKAHLERVDCIVLPSYYREGVPRILLEAASMQLPIVTTDNVGCKDIVKHGYNGYLCNKREVMDLAYWLEQMLNLPPKERVRMGVNGRILVQRFFTESLVINCYLTILQQYNMQQTIKKEEATFSAFGELEKMTPWYYQI